MQIRKFYAANLPQAVRDVRRVLGAEAVILSTRQLTTEDQAVILGGGARATVEVTAVRETPEVAEMLTRKRSAQARTADHGHTEPKPTAENKTPKKSEAAPEHKPIFSGENPESFRFQSPETSEAKPPRMRPMRPAPTPQMPEALGDGDLRSKLLRSAHQALVARSAVRRANKVMVPRETPEATKPKPEPPRQDAVEKHAQRAKNESVRTILNDLKDLSGRLDGLDTSALEESRMISAGAKAGLARRIAEAEEKATARPGSSFKPAPRSEVGGLPETEKGICPGTKLPARPFLDHLRRQGVDAVLARRLVDRMHFMQPGDKEKISDRPGSDPRGSFTRFLSAARDFGAKESAFNEDGPRRVALVGPTGVGKTTTIAKIASLYALELDKSVALVTLDTYRVAAAEQLETYARLLGVALSVVTNGEELAEALEKYADMDMVLVDTPGYSPADRAGLERLGASLSACKELEIHLVLPATQRGSEVKRVMECFRTLGFDQLVFSKLDEALEWGELLNTWIMGGFAVSYFTTGQRVPEDLENASVEKICRRLASTQQESGI